MSIGIKIAKVKKLVGNVYHKTEYVIHLRKLKEALSYELVLKKVHRIIKLNQKSWLKT